MAAKHAKRVKKKNNPHPLRETLRLTVWLLRLLQLVRYIHAALQNTGQGEDESSDENPDAGADGEPDVESGMEWGFLDLF